MAARITLAWHRPVPLRVKTHQGPFAVLWGDPPALMRNLYHHPKFTPRKPSQQRSLWPLLPCKTPAQGAVMGICVCSGSLAPGLGCTWGVYRSCMARGANRKGSRAFVYGLEEQKWVNYTTPAPCRPRSSLLCGGKRPDVRKYTHVRGGSQSPCSLGRQLGSLNT